MLSQSDIEQLKKQGKNIEKVKDQVRNFVDGFPYMRLVRPATIGDGILQLSEKDLKRAVDYYEDTLGEYRIVKFVPASGAASRMFKDLFSFMNTFNGTSEDIGEYEESENFASVRHFFSNLNRFAFYEDLKFALEKDCHSPEELIMSNKHHVILEYLLTEKGLNYGDLPKGLLKFHRYDIEARTPVEEHLVEGALYARTTKGKALLHFTVSPEHEERFRSHISEIVEEYKADYHIDYEIDFTRQKSSTDTIAVDLENNPFVLSNGEILFRPGGHGALIENLNDLDSDIIFIKNIDNVVPDHMKDTTVIYKKALAGTLLSYQEKIHYYLKILEQESTPTPSFMEEVATFIQDELCEELETGHEIIDARDYFMKKLNRPIRVCGMVRNEGEPGGGPFWAKNPDGTVSLQVVESAQVDTEDRDQQQIAGSATHFNPVDLCCGVRDFKGQKFNLTQFVDQQTGFISGKSIEGRELKALELPGLWNGSMSDWITIFVEVPIETFNPVKVVNDLLRPQHQ